MHYYGCPSFCASNEKVNLLLIGAILVFNNKPFGVKFYPNFFFLSLIHFVGTTANEINFVKKMMNASSTF